MVGALGVVEHQPVGQFLVEAGQVGEQQVFVVVDEGLLDGAVEAFDVGVHLGGFGVGVPALDAVGVERLGKAGLELGCVVREQHLGLLRQQAQGGGECGAGVAAGFAGSGHGEGKAAGRIDEGEEVAAYSVADAFDGVHRQALQGGGLHPLGLAGFGVAPDRAALPFGIEAAGCVAHLVGRAGDDPAEGGHRGQPNAVRFTPGGKQDVELFLAQVGIARAQPPHLGHEPRVGLSCSLALGRAGLRRQRRRVSAGAPQGLLPPIERPSGHPEGIPGGFKAVFVPEAQDFESSLGVFGGHLPKMPQLGYPVKPPDAVSNSLNLHGPPPHSKECQRFVNLCTGAPGGLVHRHLGGGAGAVDAQATTRHTSACRHLQSRRGACQ